jgi:hypothetical protein
MQTQPGPPGSSKLRVASPHATHQTKTERCVSATIRYTSPDVRPASDGSLSVPPHTRDQFRGCFFLGARNRAEVLFSPALTTGIGRPGRPRASNRAHPRGKPPRDTLALNVGAFSFHPARRSDALGRRSDTNCNHPKPIERTDATKIRQRVGGGSERVPTSRHRGLCALGGGGDVTLCALSPVRHALVP